MRVGIYAGESEAPALAAYAGAKALGFSVCFRNHQHWHGEIDDFDLVVVNGLWHAGSKVAKAYIAAFRPVIITDLGYLGVRGHGGYWQMGLRRLNWIPPNDCPSDRFEELGIELLDRAPLDASAPVLIAGQMPGDASHGLDEAGLQRWTEASIAILRSFGRPVIYRPHPEDRSGYIPDADEIDTGNLDKSIDRAAAVVSICSNVGNLALRRGVPVYCTGRAVYREMAVKSIFDLAGKVSAPTLGDRYGFFSRLAYAQWTIEEISSGRPLELLARQAIQEPALHG